MSTVNSNTETPGRTCEQCGNPISVDPRATHKRFCSRKCKADFWTQARKAGEAALVAAKQARGAA